MGALEGKKILWCLICDEKFSISDIEKGTYISVTGICKECYKKMWKSELTCFGKASKYEKETQECGSLCPDREVCRSFVEISVSKG